jgi:hypothetical protein
MNLKQMQEEAANKTERQPHFNQEYIRGFIECFFAIYCHDVTNFKEDLHDYGIDFGEDKNGEPGSFIISIPFAIVSDDENRFTYFNLKTSDSVEVLRQRVQHSVESILSQIHNFKNK